MSNVGISDVTGRPRSWFDGTVCRACGWMLTVTSNVDVKLIPPAKCPGCGR